MNTDERINPMRITDNDTGRVYELDFNRASVVFAENRGFEPELVSRFPTTRIPEFFYFAFRKNEPNIPRSKTDDLLKKMGGLTGPMLERLFQLYNQAASAHIIVSEEESEKNASVTVEL